MKVSNNKQYFCVFTTVSKSFPSNHSNGFSNAFRFYPSAGAIVLHVKLPRGWTIPTTALVNRYTHIQSNKSLVLSWRINLFLAFSSFDTVSSCFCLLQLIGYKDGSTIALKSIRVVKKRGISWEISLMIQIVEMRILRKRFETWCLKKSTTIPLKDWKSKCY